MSLGFAPLSAIRWKEVVAAEVSRRLADVVSKREPGHCIRVTDLEVGVAEAACQELQSTASDAQFYILGDHNNDASKLNRVSSTKLIELRNPHPDGSLRDPLIVFIPPNLRTSAEDSFGVATFEEIAFPNLYDTILSDLLETIPSSLVQAVRSMFDVLRDERWGRADDTAKCRYLLTAIENGVDGETLGASLYELNLIPDFRLFEEVSAVQVRIRRNTKCVELLANSDASVIGRIRNLGIKDNGVPSHLTRLFGAFEISEVQAWCRQVAIEKSWWPASFDKWEFDAEEEIGTLSVKSIELDLPNVEDDEANEDLAGLAGQQVLMPGSRNKIRVAIELNHPPESVAGIEYFTVQIVAEASGPVGKTKRLKAWKGNRTKATTTVSGLQRVDFDEGWHFVRILPWTSDDDPIPLEPRDGDSRPNNESDRFYVIPGGELQEEPPQRAMQFEHSVDHADLRLRFALASEGKSPDAVTVSSVQWSAQLKSGRARQTDTVQARFGRFGGFQIPVSAVLRRIEARILAAPEHASVWRLPIRVDTPESPSEVRLTIPSTGATASFMAARNELFHSIRGTDGEMISQGQSISNSSALYTAYAESYSELIRGLLRLVGTTSGSDRQKHVQALRSVLSIDTVAAELTDYRGRKREAILIPPTHPIRGAWLASWRTLADTWIEACVASPGTCTASMRSAILQQLAPSAFPAAIPADGGRVFVPVDSINPFWGLYAPSAEANPRALLAEVCAAIGLPEPSEVGSDISGSVIADKLERYLSHHPYVRELSLNVFNPGAGTVLADALVALQQKPEYADLRYDVRLFDSNPDAPVVGETIDRLTHPEATTREAADAFATSTGHHHRSKLRIAKHPTIAFQKDSSRFPAHITIMVDAFPAQEIAVASPPAGHPPVRGLVQDYRTDYSEDKHQTVWRKRPIVGNPHQEVADDMTFATLSYLAELLSRAVGTVASAGVVTDSVPAVSLSLTPEQRRTIYEAHEVSDWVFTIDRTMGIEFYDHGPQQDRPDYLIDFVPGRNTQATHNLMITSRSREELVAMVRPALEAYGLSATVDQCASVLDGLRSLSGQLALKLISAPTQRSEAAGLAFARLYLEDQGALANQIIIPLDAHIDLYSKDQIPDDEQSSASLQRTDLALFDLNLEEKSIACCLVEVKCYADVGNLSAYNQLKGSIAKQIAQSEQVLKGHFDPHNRTPDRPDRDLKNLELARILRFYLDRSTRYGVFDDSAADEAREMLDLLDAGYSLTFKRSAIIFDFEKDGTDRPELELGIEYHRIGKDLVSELLAGVAAPDVYPEGEARDSDVSASSEPVSRKTPKLESAAFIAPTRTRTSSRSTAQSDETDSESVPNESATEEVQPKSNETRAAVSVDTHSDSSNADQHEEDESKSSDVDVRSIEDSFAAEEPLPPPAYDVMLGVSGESPQYGILGETAGRKVALDLNQTHTISLFGVQGGGKSYTLGTIIEMAAKSIPAINELKSPLATVLFHYSPTMDYAPEFTTMVDRNTDQDELSILRERYGARPQRMEDIVLLAPANKVAERQEELPGVEIHPIGFASSELKASHWKFLMGAVGSQSMYLRQVNLIMKSLRDQITLESLRDRIQGSGLSDHLKELALTRLQFAAEYVDDSRRLVDLIRPGRLIIVDLRDEYVEKDEALGLFVVMLQILSEARYHGQDFNKLVVFDEAHKYIENDDLVSGLVEVVREMRHKGTSIMVASQDPPSVPTSLVELSTHIILHKFNSPAWLKHIQKANSALNELTPEKMSHLGAGEAYVWASKASDEAFTTGTVKIKCRPRVTRHGGGTKTALP